LLAVLKSPRKHRLQDGKSLLGGIKRKGGFTAPAKGTKFVESGDMIDVPMSVKDGIDTVDFLSQGLFAQVGTGIDEDFSKFTF
jgi:hypothetical protein